ncbi:MAG: hypothetical protein P8M22_03785 [Phycisphaerales bacterium]|nr:hypothetical protein [Phycisphaerales bacterium]
MHRIARLIPLMLITACLAAQGCAEQKDVPAKDIKLSKGPDGETIYLPANDSMAVSALAQYLQLKADLAGISKDGYFLDTQVANLRHQERLLSRAEQAGWKWQSANGTSIDITSALADVKKQIKTLNVVG